MGNHDLEHKTGFWQTVFNVITALVGVGLVGAPYAMAQAGLVGGIFMITIATGLCMYCGQILAKCMNDSVPGHQFLSYVDMGEYTCGRVGKVLGFYTTYIGCYAGAVFFIVASIEQFQTLFPDAPISARWWATIFTLLVLPFCYIRTLGHAGIVSFAGTVTSVVVLTMITVLVISDYMSGRTADLDTHKTMLRYDNVPILSKAFVTIIFTLGGMCIFPEVNRCMKNPQDFGRAITVACAITYVFYIGMTCVTYCVYGDYLLTSGEYANVVKMLSNNWMAKVIAASMEIHIFAAFVVTVMPIFRGAEDYLKIDEMSNVVTVRFILRTFIVGIGLVVAVLVPFFGDIMAFIGASLDSLSGVILPCIFFAILFYYRNPLDSTKTSMPATVDTPLLGTENPPTKEEIERHL
eukprot:Ihof_evm10s10 gene=Ihof_evmTU10s10